MKFYKSYDLIFTKYYGYDCFETTGFMTNEEALKLLQIDKKNKLFRCGNNSVYLSWFYGEAISKITGMNFCSFVGCR